MKEVLNVGQYFRAVCLENKQYMMYTGGGVKLTEHSLIGNSFMTKVEQALTKGGEWYRTHLVWAGDYMDEDLFLPEDAIEANKTIEEDKRINLYKYAIDNFKNVSELTLLPVGIFVGNYIVNYTKKQFVNKKLCPPSQIVQIGNG